MENFIIMLNWEEIELGIKLHCILDWKMYRARTSNCRIFYFILKLAWTVQIARYSSQIKNRFQLYSIYPRSTWNLTSQPLLRPHSDLVSSGRTWPKPPFRLWPCKPWWIYKKNIKCGWEYAVIHYPKSPSL